MLSHLPLEEVHFVAAAVSEHTQPDAASHVLPVPQEQVQFAAAHEPPPFVQSVLSAAFVHSQPFAALHVLVEPQSQAQALPPSHVPILLSHKLLGLSSQVFDLQQEPSSV